MSAHNLKQYGDCLIIVKTLYGSLRGRGYPIISFKVNSVEPFFHPRKPFTYILEILNIILEYNQLKFVVLENDMIGMVGIMYLKRNSCDVKVDTPMGMRKISLFRCTAAYSDDGYKWNVCGNLCGSPVKACDPNYNLCFGACSIVINGGSTRLYKSCTRHCTTCHECAYKIKQLNKSEQKVYVQCYICKDWNIYNIDDTCKMEWRCDHVSPELLYLINYGWYERKDHNRMIRHYKAKKSYIVKKG